MLFNVPFTNMKSKRVTTYDTTYHDTRELDTYIESEFTLEDVISPGLHYIHKWQSLVSWQYLLSSVNMTEYQLIPQLHPLLATSLEMCMMLLWCKWNVPAYNPTAIKWFPAVQEDTPHLCCGVSFLLLCSCQTAVLYGHPES